jgi:tetrahydromethanopterin S-methyltransferase subunit B
MRPVLSAASEQLIFQAVEARMAKLDQLIDVIHASMDAGQRELDALTRRVFEVEGRLELLEEWTRVRLEELRGLR